MRSRMEGLGSWSIAVSIGFLMMLEPVDHSPACSSRKASSEDLLERGVEKSVE